MIFCNVTEYLTVIVGVDLPLFSVIVGLAFPPHHFFSPPLGEECAVAFAPTKSYYTLKLEIHTVQNALYDMTCMQCACYV